MNFDEGPRMIFVIVIFPVVEIKHAFEYRTGILTNLYAAQNFLFCIFLRLNVSFPCLAHFSLTDL